MKKEHFNTATLFSFFIRIPCKNKVIRSVQCNQEVVTWSKGLQIQFSNAYNLLSRIAVISNGAGTNECCLVMSINKQQQIGFCQSLHQLVSAQRLKQ